ncbi:MAG: EF2563 family selenium-dependent molybdenum hydroxylase system protein [Anaerolineales bacterium]|nr:EF2563 family selenium-dependent molybdenum hydroxylase system protein [Anaerolineales bacterium]
MSSNLPLILIRGAGDLGSGVAYRLFKAHYPVVMTELEAPTLVRRTVSFGSAMFEGTVQVEGITARCIEASSAAWLALQAAEIPVIDDHEWRNLSPRVVIDARVAKRNIDTAMQDAELVIALGPGFSAGEDCHAVIETNRGHYLGRVIWQGAAEPNTNVPGNMMGMTGDRVLRAPVAGFVEPYAMIGDEIEAGATIAIVNGHPVIAAFTGRLRGLIHPSVHVTQGMKIGDLDPRCVYAHCFTISEKSLAIGGGVLEAILSCGITPLIPTE